MNALTVSLWVLLPLSSLLFVVTPSDGLIVEVNMVVDKSGYRLWKKLTGRNSITEFRREMESSFREIADIFYNADDTQSLGVELRLKWHAPLQRNIFCEKVGVDQAVTRLRMFLQNKDKDTDMTLFYTGRNITTPTGKFEGTALVGTVCTPNAFALLPMSSPMYNVLFGTNAIGRMLGINTKREKRDGHIMVGFGPDLMPKRFNFSDDEVNDMREKIESLTGTNNCLIDGCEVKVNRPPPLGHLINPHQMCQRSYGPDSFAYLDVVFHSMDGDELCKKILCGVFNNIEDSTFVEALPGINCDNNKECVSGKCVASDTGEPNFSRCPYGDIPYTESSKNCSEMTPVKCVEDLWYCCETCKTKWMNETVEFVCNITDGVEAVYNGYHSSICNMIKCTFGNGDNTNYHSSPNGMICEDNHQCIDGLCVDTGFKIQQTA